MIGLTYIRQVKGISMQELAKQLKVSKQTISKWENKIVKISEDRQIDLEYIFIIDRKYIINEVTDEAKLIILNKEIANIKYRNIVRST
jgi:transcriptional regulator with XRE-family HTH domain